MKNISFSGLVLLILTASCTFTRKAARLDDGIITINFVQVNDVYEIAPLNGGKEGGMARVATIKKKYLQQNPNTYLVMAGDFLSPSVYNSLKYEGKPIRGKQMIEAMNDAGMNFAIFGNHEFDIKETELQSRINESKFDWISSNTFNNKNGIIIPFVKTNSSGGLTSIPQTYIKNIRDADGTAAKIGFIGLTLPFTKTPYVSYTDALQEAKKYYNELKDSVDAVIAITHQSLEEDEVLAKAIPGLALIIGGHEHDQRFEKVGNIYITKAMANAKSAYILAMTINKKTHQVSVIPKLEILNEQVALDSATNVTVQKWVRIANDSYASLGFNATRVVLQNGESLDGRETAIRSHPTNLTKLIVRAIQAATPKSDISIMNSGSIRVDDVLQMPVTEYDVIRTLPFGGGIKEVDMNGALVVQILEAGLQNRNTGGYLQYNEDLIFDSTSNSWYLHNIAIDRKKSYRVALAEFILTGGEANLAFLTPENKNITKIYATESSGSSVLSDLRRAIIEYLGQHSGK